MIRNQYNRISHPASGGFRGGSNEPNLEPKLFHFHGEFQVKLVKLH